MFFRLISAGRKFNADTFCVVYILYTINIFDATINPEVRTNAISPAKPLYFKTITGIKVHIIIAVCIDGKISSFTGAINKACLYKGIIGESQIKIGEHIFFLQYIVEVIAHVEIMPERWFKTGVTDIHIQWIRIHTGWLQLF